MLVISDIMHLFGTSGIRRLADRELVLLALQVGLAVGHRYKNVIVGRDTRTSGPAIIAALKAGLLAAGAACSDAGVLPTPTLAYNTRSFKAGVMVTASHNPPQYNGLKLLNSDGSAFSPAQQREIEDLIAEGKPSEVNWAEMHESDVYPDAEKTHIEAIFRNIPASIPLKIVVDCGGGAAYHITPLLLARMGHIVLPLNCSAAGIFPHDIEPIEANLQQLMSAVVQKGADLGIAHDGDADRMMAIDERGRFISGDCLLSILAKGCQASSIVTTIDASMAVDELGLTVKRTPVGDPYVSEELKNGGDFGGEPSGAWVFPSVSHCPDGIYAAALIAFIAGKQPLSTLVDSLPTYPVIRANVSGQLTDIAALRTELETLHPISISTLDGLKLHFADGWLLVRPSGTEPKIRVSCEARDIQIARRIFDESTRLIQDFLKKRSA